MKKLYRILVPIVLNIILGSALIYIIAQYNLGIEHKSLFVKISSLTAISIATLILITALRGFFDLIFYVPAYGIFATIFVSYFTYYEIKHSIETYTSITITSAILFMFASILPEISRRHKIKQLASSCIKGEKLDDYSRTPWKLFDEQPKEYMCTLYFDIPELYFCQPSLSGRELKNLIEEIFARNLKTIEKYSGTIVRSTEDSMLIVFEPLEQKMISVPMEPKVYCAYSTIICALELRQNLEEIKATMNNASPLIKRLKGRCGIGSDQGLILKHIRNGRIELSLFTNSMNTIAEMLKQNADEDVLCDAKTYELCSEYFSAKKTGKNSYLIVGLSS